MYLISIIILVNEILKFHNSVHELKQRVTHSFHQTNRPSVFSKLKTREQGRNAGEMQEKRSFKRLL